MQANNGTIVVPSVTGGSNEYVVTSTGLNQTASTAIPNSVTQLSQTVGISRGIDCMQFDMKKQSLVNLASPGDFFAVASRLLLCSYWCTGVSDPRFSDGRFIPDWVLFPKQCSLDEP